MKLLAIYLLWITGLSPLGFIDRPAVAIEAGPASSAEEDYLCQLPSPSYVNVLVITTTTVTIEWDNVRGATHYRVKTIAAGTDAVYQSQVVKAQAGAVNTLTTGYGSAGTFYLSVASICSNGVEGY